MRVSGRITAVFLLLVSATLAARGEDAAPPPPDANQPVAVAPAEATVQDKTELMVAGPLGDMTLGDPKAPVTVIEYASMTCPHCQRFQTGTFPQFKTKYIDTGKVYFILREYPLDDLALAAIMLARCAPADKFFPVVDILFEMQSNWADAADPGAAIFGYLQPLGFTEETFNTCLDNQKILDGVNAVRQRAEDKFGVRGTPTFFFNGQQQVGELSIEEVDKILAPML